MQIKMQKSGTGGKNAAKEDTKTRSPKERARNKKQINNAKNTKNTLLSAIICIYAK